MRKTNILLVALFILAGPLLLAQETFIIEGDTLELRREVKGPLSLYWTTQDKDFRYFVQKGDRIVELRNTRPPNAEKKLFREQLGELTADAKINTKDVKFALYSLKHFVNLYNARVKEDYEYNAATANIQHRLGLFSGISNNPYTENPENILVPVLGLEYEFLDPNLAPRHSAFVHLRQSFTRDEFRYSSTQLSLNYRFKMFYFSGWDLHLDAELATFYYSQDRIYIRNEEGEITAIKDDSGFSFTAPFNFGIGTDIRITENGFITLSYNDVVSIVMDSNGNFPIDFTVGYKYRL